MILAELGCPESRWERGVRAQSSVRFRTVKMQTGGDRFVISIPRKAMGCAANHVRSYH